MRRFLKNNQEFTCINCSKEVSPHPTSSRDHCNYCLYGLHVDINPGDRLNTCRGILKPVGIKKDSKKEQIVYICEKCQAVVFCLTAPDDDRNLVVSLYSRIWS